MLSFKAWCEQQMNMAIKPWKADKKEIIGFWNTLPPSMPIQPFKIVPGEHHGSTYMYDGVRVTGTQQFINSVVSRIKDLLNYDKGETRLHLLYRQQVDKESQQPLPNSFVFYVQVRERLNDLRSSEKT
jgi:hypothetical protein